MKLRVEIGILCRYEVSIWYLDLVVSCLFEQGEGLSVFLQIHFCVDKVKSLILCLASIHAKRL